MVALIIGTFFGLMAGYFRRVDAGADAGDGWPDGDPGILLAIALVAAWGRSYPP